MPTPPCQGATTETTFYHAAKSVFPTELFTFAVHVKAAGLCTPPQNFLCGFKDFFRNNGHGFMNADAALANGVDAMLSTFNGEENNVANPEHPTSVLQMRNACKNVMYTVVSSWAYDGKHKETSMENWKKAAIGIDVVIVLFMAGMEVLVIRGYKKRKNAE